MVTMVMGQTPCHVYQHTIVHKYYQPYVFLALAVELLAVAASCRMGPLNGLAALVYTERMCGTRFSVCFVFDACGWAV